MKRLPEISFTLLITGLAALWQPMCVNAQDNDPESDTVSAVTRQAGNRPSVNRKPVWEVGVGGGYFSGYDYPASNDENKRFVALPFFVYRSPQLRFGGGGLRAVAIEKPRLKLDLSISGSLNASSTGNSVREGMPDLDFLFEIGPQLELRWFDKIPQSGGRIQGRITSELRAVFATDFRSVGFQGLVAELGAGVIYRRVRGSGFDLFAAVDMTYANERMQDYFYQVDPEYATSQRPAYDATGGYLQSKVFAGVGTQPLPNVRVFLGASTGFYSGASNEESPLFETRHSTGVALGVVWTIKTSDTYVDIVDLGDGGQ